MHQKVNFLQIEDSLQSVGGQILSIMTIILYDAPGF